MTVKVKFFQIQVNTIAFAGVEIVFPYEGEWYRMSWEYVPDRFKELYVAKLRLANTIIPACLTDYITETLDMSSLDIELNLDLAEKLEMPGEQEN